MTDIFYRNYASFLREKFGCNAYKIPININTTCPNRDGTLSRGGCIYCSREGSGTGSGASVREQVTQFIERNKGKYSRFIPYFQSYCNMYGDSAYLLSKYTEAIGHPLTAGIAIATRPDTVNEEVLRSIASLGIFTQIELGLESANNDTLQRINRHERAETFVRACSVIRAVIPDAHIVGHMIIGLPGETEEDYFNTMSMIEDNADGIKFHNLYIIRDTPIADMFYNGDIELLRESEYIEIIIRLIRAMSEDMVVHRLKSSADPRRLIAPLWVLDRYFHEKIV
ncbi:MAG: TIGR01212 family radical SAM protein, partial [bacterium]